MRLSPTNCAVCNKPMENSPTAIPANPAANQFRAGTSWHTDSYLSMMTERLDAWMIAWSYLDRTGQITNTYDATQRLSAIFARLTKAGTTNPLLLANKAISEYERDQFLFREAV